MTELTLEALRAELAPIQAELAAIRTELAAVRVEGPPTGNRTLKRETALTMLVRDAVHEAVAELLEPTK